MSATARQGQDRASTITILIKGPQGSGKTTIAAAIHAMLIEGGFSDVRVVNPDEPRDVDKAIERLWDLQPGPRVEIDTESIR